MPVFLKMDILKNCAKGVDEPNLGQCILKQGWGGLFGIGGAVEAFGNGGESRRADLVTESVEFLEAHDQSSSLRQSFVTNYPVLADLIAAGCERRGGGGPGEAGAACVVDD